MTIPSHIILGTIVGTVTGNVPLAVVVSVAIDIDHLVSYFKSGVIFEPKELWQTITSREDLTGDQRGYLHNVLVATLISSLVWLVWSAAALTFTLSYFGHLFLDALDDSEYWPLYPSKQIILTGVVSFYSWHEIIFSVGMLFVLYLLNT